MYNVHWGIVWKWGGGIEFSYCGIDNWAIWEDNWGPMGLVL